MSWGPPVYIPVAGYFKLGKGGKKSRVPKPKAVPVGPGDTKKSVWGKGNDLRELLGFFDKRKMN
jgi:hypothetical protein